METPENRGDSISYYKELDPEGYEAYVEWCKSMEKSTGKNFIIDSIISLRSSLIEGYY